MGLIAAFTIGIVLFAYWSVKYASLGLFYLAVALAWLAEQAVQAIDRRRQQ